jgi:hypothetical protein
MRTIPGDIAFTPAVKAIQERKGSRQSYARMERVSERARSASILHGTTRWCPLRGSSIIRADGTIPAETLSDLLRSTRSDIPLASEHSIETDDDGSQDMLVSRDCSDPRLSPGDACAVVNRGCGDLREGNPPAPDRELFQVPRRREAEVGTESRFPEGTDRGRRIGTVGRARPSG